MPLAPFWLGTVDHRCRSLPAALYGARKPDVRSRTVSHLGLNSCFFIACPVCIVCHMDMDPRVAKSIARVATSTVVMTAGLGLAGLGAEAIAQVPTALPSAC